MVRQTPKQQAGARQAYETYESMRLATNVKRTKRANKITRPTGIGALDTLDAADDDMGNLVALLADDRPIGSSASEKLPSFGADDSWLAALEPFDASDAPDASSADDPDDPDDPDDSDDSATTAAFDALYALEASACAELAPASRQFLREDRGGLARKHADTFEAPEADEMVDDMDMAGDGFDDADVIMPLDDLFSGRDDAMAMALDPLDSTKDHWMIADETEMDAITDANSNTGSHRWDDSGAIDV